MSELKHISVAFTPEVGQCLIGVASTEGAKSTPVSEILSTRKVEGSVNYDMVAIVRTMSGAEYWVRYPSA